METEVTTLPKWRVRLMRAHEHETVPVGGKRPLSSQAAAAKMIRNTLKSVFPGVMFTVRSDSFAGGDSIDIAWTDGPTTDMVDTIIDRHQYGHFDGMIDLYEYSSDRDDIPQAKYVHGQREFSRSAYLDAVAYMNHHWGLDLVPDPDHNCLTRATDNIKIGNTWASSEILHFLHKHALVCDACDWPTLPTDQFCPQCGASLKAAES